MSSAEHILDHLMSRPIIPVIELNNADDAVPLARALLAGGIDVVEVTFRTAAAAAAIARIISEVPQMHVAAGTVVSAQQAQSALDLGVSFGVAPGLNPDTVKRFQDAGTLFIPGVVTPSEIERGLSLDLTLLKFFPAEAAGGIAMLKALSGPYASQGVRFCPTGGVNLSNLNEYLSLPVVACIGGSWIATRQQIEAGDWDGITERAAGALKACTAD